MAHEADHEQVDIQQVDQPDDRVDDVTRHEVRLDRHTGGCSLSFCGRDDGRKTMVGLVFLLRDFIDTRRKTAAAPRPSPCGARLQSVLPIRLLP
jgi:hypothetical protein